MQLPTVAGPVPAVPAAGSIDVNGTTEVLSPTYSLLTDNALNDAYIDVNGNITGNPAFVNDYLNGARIEEHLLVTAPGNCQAVLDCLERRP